MFSPNNPLYSRREKGVRLVWAPLFFLSQIAEFPPHRSGPGPRKVEDTPVHLLCSLTTKMWRDSSPKFGIRMSQDHQRCSPFKGKARSRKKTNIFFLKKISTHAWGLSWNIWSSSHAAAPEAVSHLSTWSGSEEQWGHWLACPHFVPCYLVSTESSGKTQSETCYGTGGVQEGIRQLFAKHDSCRDKAKRRQEIQLLPGLSQSVL